MRVFRQLILNILPKTRYCIFIYLLTKYRLLTFDLLVYRWYIIGLKFFRIALQKIVRMLSYLT